MNKKILFFITILTLSYANAQEQYITRQGEVTFFSYTSVENIQAYNKQVLSIINPTTNEVAVQILMRAFVFEKSLMYEHFNESYIESDLYRKATFDGMIVDFDPNTDQDQTKIIKGKFTLRGITKDIEIKATIAKTNTGYEIEGNFDVSIKDYDIKVPPILSPNIAKNIQVSFNFQYAPYESQK